MKKKGFTLVELLAVIVILAIIALIAIPLIGNIIEKAKIGALESSVNGLVESANMYYANETIKGSTISETIFDFEDGEQTSTQKLEYKGKVYNGKLILHANGEVAVCIDDEEHYAYKNKDTDEIVSGVGTCLYDGTTGDFSSNSSINDLRGKTLVATDISQSEDGLSTLIKILEEGHYDKNSVISIENSKLNNFGKNTFLGYNRLIVNNVESVISQDSLLHPVDTSYSYALFTTPMGDTNKVCGNDTKETYIGYDFKEKVSINKVTFSMSCTRGDTWDINYQLQYSDDGITWNNASDKVAYTAKESACVILSNIQVNARYWRVYISSDYNLEWSGAYSNYYHDFVMSS